MAGGTIAEQVIGCLREGRSFVVDAGAGSGKTYTLVESLMYLLTEYSDEYRSKGQQIVCVTYTNVAVDEIKARINSDPLVRVSTIHDFLWSVIRDHQKELRKCIVDANMGKKESERTSFLDLTGIDIEYWQYGRDWQEGKIHHDDVITFASQMFLLYPKLSRLVADRYPVIFVDEYQDTQSTVVDLLLDALVNADGRSVIIGFFGDHMQKIYRTGVGRLNRPELEFIQKVENYRCSTEVIDVLNRLRPALQQVPAGKGTKQGSARFFYSKKNDANVGLLQERLRNEGWEPGEKVLMLTHRRISQSLGWDGIRALYGKRGRYALDDLLRGDDDFSETFQTIEDSVIAFSRRRYGEVYSLLSVGSRNSDERFADPHGYKVRLSGLVARLAELCSSATVGDVLDYVWSSRLLPKAARVSRLEERVRSDADIGLFLSDLRSLPYSEVSSLLRYLRDDTQYSTKHGTKGEEYDDVIVVIDDRAWNQYNFASVLRGDASRPQYERSLNLFYVCCSRAKRNLAVLMESAASDDTIEGARRIFGDRNVVML